MKIRCAWHKKNFGKELFMGEKAPYDDPGITDSICSDCYRLELGRLKPNNSPHLLANKNKKDGAE